MTRKCRAHSGRRAIFATASRKSLWWCCGRTAHYIPCTTRSAEDAPGASLSKDQAEARGEEFLRTEKHVDLAQWSQVESKSDKQPHRVDHTLTWQQNRDCSGRRIRAIKIGSAHVRIELQVLGDEVANYRTYVKIPDDWRRQQGRVDAAAGDTVDRVADSWFWEGWLLTALIVFLKNLRSEDARSIPWRRIGGWGLWGLVAT